MNAPCKDCPKRVLGCHSTCAEYKEKYDRFLDAMDSIICYDGHYEWLNTIRDEMNSILSSGEKYVHYDSPFDYTEWHTEKHTIFMLLVGMLGDWGTSIRSGWIDDLEGCIEFIDTICEKEREERTNL